MPERDMSRSLSDYMTPNRTEMLIGIILFVIGGLIFDYGLGIAQSGNYYSGKTIAIFGATFLALGGSMAIAGLVR